MADDMKILLECTRCSKSADGDGPIYCDFERRDDDPDTVVRCDVCGKKHSKDSLHALPADGLEEVDVGAD